jgi:hypothetical protein
MAFPYWLMPFSNTIGYFFTYVTGVNSFLKSILKDSTTLNLKPDQAAMVKALNNIYEDSSLTINDITLDNLPSWWERMTKSGMLKPGINTTHYEELFEYVNWYNKFRLHSSLCYMMSINYKMNHVYSRSV